MEAHPDFAGTRPPRSGALPSFDLTPLDARVAEEDFAVISASGAILAALSDDLPAGLSAGDNLTDLHWHDREFTLGRSFSWVVRDKQGLYLGCVYLFPALGARGQAKVVTWIRARPDRAGLTAVLNRELETWLPRHLPPSVTLTWKSPPAHLEETRRSVI